MSFEQTDADQLRELASELGWELSAAKAEVLATYIAPFSDGYRWLDEQGSGLPAITYPQREYTVPSAATNPHNAWALKTNIKTCDTGLLAGRRIAVKDNIFVAGLPLGNGSEVLADFVADFDATVVERVLDAGAIIAGKSNCEYFCLSGGSTTSCNGPVDNPRKRGFSTAGSSSGSAALVAAGEVDMALGTDQGGSVRSPASWTGICGMKATRGTVPYNGAMVMETAIDYIGPLSASVADNALLLDVIAEPHERAFNSRLGEPITGLNIGVLDEGFAHPLSNPLVDEAVRDGAKKLGELGANLSSVSVPAHLDGLTIWGAIVSDGYWQTLRLNGLGYNYDGWYSPQLFAAMADWPAHLPRMPINAQVLMLLGKHLERYHGRYYGQAKNLARQLRRAYDLAFENVDCLLMPTTVQCASANPASDDLDGIFAHAFNNTINTAQFNATGHPAVSIPIAVRDDCPIGLMLVGPYRAEARLYQIAYALEQAQNWQQA